MMRSEKKAQWTAQVIAGDPVPPGLQTRGEPWIDRTFQPRRRSPLRLLGMLDWLDITHTTPWDDLVVSIFDDDDEDDRGAPSPRIAPLRLDPFVLYQEVPSPPRWPSFYFLTRAITQTPTPEPQMPQRTRPEWKKREQSDSLGDDEDQNSPEKVWGPEPRLEDVDLCNLANNHEDVGLRGCLRSQRRRYGALRRRKRRSEQWSVGNPNALEMVK